MKPGFLCLAAAAWLAACDGGASAVPARDHSTPAALEQTIDVQAEAPVPTLDGKPIWSSNASHSAEENAAYHYERDGTAFGARSLDEFVRKAHAFVGDPPDDAEVLTRANGDRLIYHAASNTFAVATREGAPRTMFKPDDGPAYWAKQKAREASREG